VKFFERVKKKVSVRRSKIYGEIEELRGWNMNRKEGSRRV